MSQIPDGTPQRRSALWLWGFWACAVPAVAAFVLSLSAPPPVDRVPLGVSGVLFIVGGLHQGRVVAYKRATRGPFSTLGQYSYLYQRQMGWSAVVLGAAFILSAVVGL